MRHPRRTIFKRLSCGEWATALPLPYVGIAPLRLPPALPSGAGRPETGGFPTNRHCPKLSASAETEAEAPFRDAGLT